VRGADQFHLGIVVDDLDAGLAELSALFGYEWCPQIAVQTPVVLPETDIMLDLRFTYSVTTPRVEVIQSVPGTPWVPVPGSGLHHAGYWSDDPAADAALLVSQGYADEARGMDADGSPAWTYHRSPSGLRIELVSRRLQPGLEQYWASGSGSR